MSVNELSKKEQRKEAKQKIAILTLEEKANKSRKVFLSILDCGLIKNDKLLFCYISTADEVSTEAIIDNAEENDIKIAVPCIYGDKMYAIKYFGKETLTQNKYGIYEPKFDDAKIAIFEDAVVLVPLLGFDENMNRLGHGKGFYDRFFAENPNCAKIGLAFEEQKFDKVIHDRFDVQMDYVVTDKNIYEAKKKA